MEEEEAEAVDEDVLVSEESRSVVRLSEETRGGVGGRGVVRLGVWVRVGCKELSAFVAGNDGIELTMRP